MDRSTGEIMDLQLVEPRRRSHKHTSMNFVKVYIDRMGEILDADLTREEWRLLWTLLARAAYNGDRPLDVNVTKLAAELGSARTHTSKRLSSLVTKKILVRDPDNPRLIWISPRYAWNGDEAPRRRAEDRLAV